MSVLRSVPIGAVCLLYAAMLSAAPVSHPSPPVVATAPSLASSPLQEAVRRIWQASPEVQAARADLDAARARARAAAQPLYNPSLSLDAENADVNRRTAGISLPLDLSGKRRARTSQGEADLLAAEASYDVRRRDVATRWLKAWSTAALAARQSELGRRRLALMQRFDDLAAQRLKVGDISSPERDLAGLALGEAQVQQATLAGNEAAARAALLAISGDQPLALPPLPTGALTLEKVGAAIAHLMPDDAVVVNEAITSGAPVAGPLQTARGHDWLVTMGGAIGAGLPTAVGAAVACPDRKVLCLSGDGSAMYTLQSLWTMAREGLDVCTVIFANDTYRILHGELLNVGATPGRNVARMFDMVDPVLDWVALAKGHGVQAERVETAEAFSAAFTKAMATKGPRLIVVPC